MLNDEGTVQEEPHTLLFVDDEEGILNSLRRLFYKESHRILTTTSAREGLALIESHPVTLVISDHRMPEMEGTKFLARVKEVKPDVVRIMLTGYADMKAAVEAINQCQVYRFISKPWNDDDLRLTVRGALREVDLAALNKELTGLVKQQNQELYDVNRKLESRVREQTRQVEEKNRELSDLVRRLKADFLEMIQALISLMELKSPTLVGHARRVALLAKEMSARLGLSAEEQEFCEVAALLIDIGMLGYPDHIIRTPEQKLDNIGRALWQKHPLLGEACLKGIERLQPVSSIIRTHHERFDGKGFPDSLRGDRIPLPARIVAAADYYDLLINPLEFADRLSTTRALDLLEEEKGLRFDPTVVHLLKDLVEKAQAPADSDEIEIPVHALAEGMTVVRDLTTLGGIFLLPAGSTLQARQLEKILNFHRIDPIVDRVYVFRKKS